jgi:phosphatidylserine/phosphatidylglycerophosphate/cardiolipin synthase-like enzyme
MYQFTSASLAQGLIDAKNRGVQVRVLMDSVEAAGSLSKETTLKSGGVSVEIVKVTGGTYGNKFHHKFCIIDGKTLLTGSYNWTESADTSNYENYCTIKDAAILSCFTTEFDSLWTSKTGGVGSGTDVVFAPSGAAHAIENRIATEIGGAASEIVIAMYQFTSPTITSAVVAAEGRGVKVWVLTDLGEASTNKATLDALKAAGAYEKAMNMGSGSFAPEFHDKYCVIDGKTVITGSFNWNINQDQNGYENVVVLHDGTLAKTFVEDFLNAWGQPNAK